MRVFEIMPEGRSWRLSAEDDADGVCFATLTDAERRARWLAVRQEVKGMAAEIQIRDLDGALVGRWRGERYEMLCDLDGDRLAS